MHQPNTQLIKANREKLETLDCLSDVPLTIVTPRHAHGLVREGVFLPRLAGALPDHELVATHRDCNAYASRSTGLIVTHWHYDGRIEIDLADHIDIAIDVLVTDLLTLA